MRILLDTQCWLWMTGLPGNFSEESRQMLESKDNRLYFSAASTWEISIKYALAKLRLPDPPEQFVSSRIDALGIVPLSVEHNHASRVASLPFHHRDPFDRMLVAQAQLEDLAIMTSDAVFSRYQVEIIRA